MLAGISVTWLGNWVAVASGLGVRVTSDGGQTVTVKVDADLWGSTQGLCGPYNDDPAGKRRLTCGASAIPGLAQMQCGGSCAPLRPPTCPSPPCAPR